MDGLAVDVVTGWSAVAWLAAWSVPLSIVDLRTGRLPSPMVNRLLAGLVVLTLAGDGALRAKVEALEVSLRDVTRPYLATSGKLPDHGA